MKKEAEAIRRLTTIQSEVSSHYFIKKNGNIVLLVPDLYVAWHAGKSMWHKKKFLNSNSIGIEISNPGHNYGYLKYKKKQIISLTKLLLNLKKNYKIKPENILGHSDIAPDRKKDPGEKFPWRYLSKKKIGIFHDLDQKKIIIKRKKNIDKFELFLSIY